MQDRVLRFGIDPYRGTSTQIWQGTILEGCGLNSGRKKLVVSADCDLTDEKGHKDFFSLDVVPIDEYLKRLVMGDARDELLAILIQTARDTAKNRSSSFSSVSNDVFSEWLMESNGERWEKDLPNLHKNEHDLLVSIQNCIYRLNNRGVIAPASSGSDSGSEALLLSCPNEQLNKTIAQINKQLKAALASKLSPSRVDLYIFPVLPGDSDLAGYVVSFKSLELMSRDQTCMRTSELRDNPNAFMPRAVCRPVLLHSLMQKMATFFIRIGLANGFKQEQETVVKAVMESIQ